MNIKCSFNYIWKKCDKVWINYIRSDNDDDDDNEDDDDDDNDDDDDD